MVILKKTKIFLDILRDKILVEFESISNSRNYVLL